MPIEFGAIATFLIGTGMVVGGFHHHSERLKELRQELADRMRDLKEVETRLRGVEQKLAALRIKAPSNPARE